MIGWLQGGEVDRMGESALRRKLHSAHAAAETGDASRSVGASPASPSPLVSCPRPLEGPSVACPISEPGGLQRLQRHSTVLRCTAATRLLAALDATPPARSQVDAKAIDGGSEPDRRVPRPFPPLSVGPPKVPGGF